MNRKVITYILISFFCFFPFLISLIGGEAGNFLIDFISELYSLIANASRYSLIVGFTVSFIAFFLLVVHVYITKKRTVSFTRYFISLLMSNLTFFFLLVASSTIGLLALTYLIALGTDKIFLNVKFIHVNNFPTLYFIELYLYSIYVSIKAASSSIQRIENVKNVLVCEKVDRLEKKEFSGNIGEYFDEINKELQAITTNFCPSNLNVSLKFDRLSLNDKINYLKNIDKNIDKAIDEFARANNLELESIHSNYEEYVGFDYSQKPGDLAFKNENISKIKYTLYKYLRTSMVDINKINTLYLNGKSDENNTIFNRLDEIILEKQIYNASGIEIMEKPLEIATFYANVIKELNLLLSQIKWNKKLILDNKAIVNFDKEAFIIRNVMVNDEIVANPDSMIISKRGIYTIRYQDFDKTVDNVLINDDLKWIKVNSDGTKEIIGNVLKKTDNDLYAENLILSKKIKTKIDVIPMIIVRNNNVVINNNSSVLILKEEEIYEEVMKNNEIYDEKTVNEILKIFSNNQEVSKEYIQIDYEKYFSDLLNMIVSYCNNEIAYYKNINNAYKELITNEKMCTKNYLESYEKVIPLFYSYDYCLHHAGQKYYADKEYDIKLSYDTKKVD